VADGEAAAAVAVATSATASSSGSGSSSHSHSHVSERVSLSSVRFPAMPLAALEEMVRTILSEVPGIARVCYDLTCKPPATTEWE
jgi:GMP synthase PP-ATPase subunit